MITREFDLMLYQEGNLLFINANQYDSGEQWIFTLYEENGVKYTPATGAIVGVKSDGKGIINTGTVDEYGRVVINETQQMTAAAGLATFELLIDNDTHGTANFKVDVEPRPADNADLSDSDLSLIQEAIDSAEVIVEVIGDSDPSEVIGEHVDAWLDNHPEATTTVLDGAITAPKINQSLWDKLLVSEEASGNPASFDDGADDVPVSSLKVALEPVQLGSGDPSPSNIRPIYPANGKNLYNASNLNVLVNNGITATVNDGTITLNGTATSNAYFNVNNTGLPSGTYTLSYNNPVADSNVHIALRTSSNTYYSDTTANSVNRVATSTGEPDDIIIYVTSGTTLNNFVLKPMLETGSTASAYQPHQGIMVERKSVNQWDEQWELGGISNQNGTNYGASDRIRSKNYIPCLPNTTYYFKTPAIMGTVAFYNSSQTFISALSNFAGGTFTTPANTKYIRFCGTNAYGATYNNDISINYPSTITDYHAYIGTSYPCTLGQSVYGGTVDLATGVLTVTHGIADENSFTALATGLSGGGLHWAEYTTSDITINGYALSNMVDRKDGGTGWASTTPCFAITDLSRLRVYCAESTLADFKSAYSGLQIIYPLATPQTIQLTPTEVKTLLGYNNISSTGTVDVIYHADTKLYVDKMTAVDNNIIAPTEADFVATRNYTVNDLLIVADTLYKVTSNIATGSAITPNSNVTQTTLSALIKALS